MKNKWMVWGISGAVMLILVTMISVFSIMFVRKGGPIMMLPAQGELRNTIEIPLSQAMDISIAYTSDNLKIYPIEGDSVIIKEYLSSKRKNALAAVSIENGRAVVTGGERQMISFMLWGSLNERIEIYLPKKGLNRMEITAQSGNITGTVSKSDTDLLTAEEICVKASSGNIKVDSLHAQEMTLETHSGNISVGNIEGKVQVQATSGNITIRGISGEGRIQAASGNVTVTDFSGYGEARANSGNVRVEAKEITGDLTLSANSGNVKLVLPKSLSFHLTADTGSGNIHTDFDENLSYNKKRNHADGTVGNDPSCAISAEAGSGNVSIRR